MPETFDQQLARLRDLAAIHHAAVPADRPDAEDLAALAELLRRWDEAEQKISDLQTMRRLDLLLTPDVRPAPALDPSPHSS